MKTSGSFGLRICAALVALGFAFTASADISASAYVQTGLVAQWDGIENAGAGQHDANATTWVDLAGNGLDATLNKSYEGCWSANSLKMNNSLYASFVTNFPGSFTVEIICSAPFSGAKSMYNTLFCTTDDAYSVYKNGNSLTFKQVPANGSRPSIANYDGSSVVCTIDGKTVSIGYQGQSPVASTGTAISETGDRTWCIGGADSGHALIGEIFAVRIYNRALTAAEVAMNAAIDKVRFEGADPADVMPQGCRWNSTTGEIECRISVACDVTGGGIVTVGGEDIHELYERWCEVGQVITLTAVPDLGREFYCWTGDVEGLSLKEKMRTTFEITVNEPCNVCLGAAFRAAGSGVHLIPTKFATLAAALASDQVMEGDVIRFATGTHVFDASAHVTDETTTYSCLGAIRKSVIVEGAGSSPNDTQIDCGGSGGIIVDNPEAVVRNLSFTNFVNTTAKAEPLFYVNQGVASNVWINGAMPGAANSYKGIKSFVYVGSGALFTDSQVFAVTNIQWDGANLVSLNAGTMRRCKLFRNNITTSIANSAASQSSIENCEFSDNYGYACGGANCAKACNVRNTLFTRNQASGTLALLLASGSSAYGCRMIGNVYNATYKSGVVLQCNGWTSVTVENCLIANNQTYDVAPIGLGGSHGQATFRNTTIANNDSKIGTISCFCGSDNGTSEANKLTLVNAVIYGNTAGGAVQTFNPLSIYTTYDIRHCNYPEADPNDGKGNFYADPRFADAANGDYQLGKGSPCVDVGEEISTLTEDIDGTERPQDGDGDGIALWDVGCYEKLPTTAPIECALAASLTESVFPGKASLTAVVTGPRISGLSFKWMAICELNGTVTTNAAVTSEASYEFTWLPIGNYRFACLVTNDAVPPDSALDETTVAAIVYPETTYVSLTGENVWPYASEVTAARNFSDAAGCAGRKVVVAPGVYRDFAHVTDAVTGYDCIGSIRRGVTVEGTANAADVVFDCGGRGGIVLGHPDARIHGVTFANFMTAAGSGPALYVESGSASNIVVNGGTTLTELGTCVYFGEYAVGDEINIFGLNHAKSGGAPLLKLYGATLRNSRFENCRVDNSDCAAQSLPAERGTRSRIEYCQFVGNKALAAGALYAKNTDIYRSHFEGNSDANANNESRAAAVRFGQSSMTECTVVGNSGQDVLGFDQIWSSDAYVGAITNCLIANNTSGARPALDVNTSNTKVDIVNCTIVNNKSISNTLGTAKSGGIGWLKPGTAPRVTVVNTIIWGNTVDGEVKDLPADMDSKINISISHCCFSEANDWTGPGNIAKDPCMYSGRRIGMLRGGSPCIDAGDNLGWTADDVDLAGATRIYNKVVDIGCYEKGPTPGLAIVIK